MHKLKTPLIKAIILTVLKKIVYSMHFNTASVTMEALFLGTCRTLSYQRKIKAVYAQFLNKISQEFCGLFSTIPRRRQNTTEVGLKFSETSAMSYENRHLTRSRVAAGMGDIRYPQDMCYIYEFPVKVIFYLTSPSAV